MAKRPKTDMNMASDAIEQAPAASKVARGTVLLVLHALDDHVRHEINELKEFNNPDKADALALLGVKVSQMQEAQRKLEAEERKASSKLTVTAVRAFLQALPKEEWAHLRREIDQSHAGGSVLG